MNGQHLAHPRLSLSEKHQYISRYNLLEPLGIILCAGKKHEQIECLGLDKSSIHVAEYLTALPTKKLLAAKLHESIKQAKQRLMNDHG